MGPVKNINKQKWLKKETKNCKKKLHKFTKSQKACEYSGNHPKRGVKWHVGVEHLALNHIYFSIFQEGVWILEEGGINTGRVSHRQD